MTYTEIRDELRFKFMMEGETYQSQRWQGLDIARIPGSKMVELLMVDFKIDLNGIMDPGYWAEDTHANMPWAEDHFQERICGVPINPGIQWELWPHGGNARKFLNSDGQFNHNYMERYWPKDAGKADGEPLQTSADWPLIPTKGHRGIRNEYGDLNNLIELLCSDPETRQAYLPIFFPEDTGIGDGGRKPCTLGYQFLRRGDRLHVFYPMRSCDFYNHWADDMYLTIRLLIWVIEQCQSRSNRWDEVVPGTFHFSCTNLHVFINDFYAMKSGRWLGDPA